MAVLVADPPWSFSDRLPGPGRGAAKHYRCMSVDALCRFPLPPLQRDCYLFMWRVAAMAEEAYRVVRAWGFTPKAELIWIKKTKTGRRHFGLGRHVRAEHEACIIAVRNKPRPLCATIRSTFEAPVASHSEKPDAFYAIVEQFAAPPYTELFARRRRPGWQCYGDELP